MKIKCIQIAQHGEPDQVMKVVSVDMPEPTDTQVLVKVQAIATNPVDWKIVGGWPVFGQFPATGGCDMSGTVIKVGKKVTRFSVGDSVFGCQSISSRQGAFGQYTCVDELCITKKPEKISFAEAASFMLVGLTMWDSFMHRAQPEAGEWIFINGGAGGTGSITIQFAKYLGLKVITSASRTESIAWCKKMGADHVINYKTENVAEQVKKLCPSGVDIIADLVGHKAIAQMTPLLAEQGRYILIVLSSVEEMAPVAQFAMKNQTFIGVLMGLAAWKGDRKTMRKYAAMSDKFSALIGAGMFKSITGKLFTGGLEDIPTALALQKKGGISGKIVVENLH